MVVSRGALIAAGTAFTLLTAWGGGCAWYLLFRDQLAARMLAQQADMQYAYEAKVGSLRARLDRVASQKLLEQDGLEGRVADLLSRQVQLESRQTMLATLASQAGSLVPAGSLRQPQAASAAAQALPEASPDPFAASRARPPGDVPEARAYLPAKPIPAPDSFGLRLRETEPQERGDPRRESRVRSSVEQTLAQVDRAMNRIEAAQLRELDAHLQRAQGEVARLRGAVSLAGLDPDLVQPPATASVGGPLVPLSVDPKAGPFEALVDRVQTSVTQAERLRRVTVALPFGRPIAGEPEQTSGFGYRLDPFTRAPALHTGLDFRAEAGSPVRATAAGRVVTAEYSGGYGNLVEIDHGNGIATRYGHLSSIGVIPGQIVVGGAIVGRVGSTGRSTGPHLHYETRINDDPVDPQRFLKAGAKLASR